MPSYRIIKSLNSCPKIIGNERSFFQISIDIMGCLFNRIINNGSGGAIYLDYVPFNMTILESSFFECISTKYGGGIYFYRGNSSILKKI